MSSFFRINFPYGIARNEKDEWMAFNRLYLPLGFTDENLKGDPGWDYQEYPVYSKYKSINQKLLRELADGEDSIHRDKNNQICKVFLYGDNTSPSIQGHGQAELWKKYFRKVQLLAKLYVPNGF